MKHLVIVVNAPSNALNQREEFIRYFKQKYRLSLICPNASSLKKEALFENVELIDLPFTRTGTTLTSEFKVLLALHKLFKKLPKDAIVHNFTIKPILYSSLLHKLFFSKKLRCFSTFTGLGYLFSEGSKKKTLQKIISSLLRFCLFNNSSSVVFQNYCDQKSFIDKRIVSKESNVILGSGVNTDHFYMSAKLPEKPLRYLFIGRILKDKGIVELLNSFKNFNLKHPNAATLKLAGDFDMENPQFVRKDEFKDLMSEGVEYLGYKDDLRPLIEESDIVVLPSYREGLPLALIQACSMGKIILTTDAPGCKEMVEADKNGIKVTSQSTTALESAFKHFNSLDRDELFQMAKESRKLAENKFSSEVVNRQIERLYANI